MIFFRGRFTSPKSQLTIASILVVVEMAFDAGWLLKEPPTIEHSYPSREANVRVCRGSEDGSYVIGLLYPFLLTGEFSFIRLFYVLSLSLSLSLSLAATL